MYLEMDKKSYYFTYLSGSINHLSGLIFGSIQLLNTV